MYAILSIIGILLIGVIFCKRIKKKGMDDNDAILFLLWLGGGALVGSHILYGIVNFKYMLHLPQANTFWRLVSVFVYTFGGAVFYGGLIGAMITGLIVIKVKKYPYYEYTDNLGQLAPLFHGFARIGCFLGGCCYGIESDFGFTAHGNELVPELNDVCRFPVQLLESACNFIISGILLILLKKFAEKGERKLRGLIFPLYLLMYTVVRFSDEFLRGDVVRGFFLGTLSTSQCVSILLFITAWIWIAVELRKRKKAEPLPTSD